MRTHHALTAALVSLVCAASCVQSPPETSEADGPSAHGPALEIRDFEDDPEIGSGSGPADGSEEAPQTVIKDICVAAAISIDTKEAFCRSALVAPGQKKPCWSLVPESAAKWIGWCSWNF